jgi:hypothetical protein
LVWIYVLPTPREENFRFDGPRNFSLKETPFKNQGDGKMCVFFQRACSKEIYVIVTERGLEQLQQLQQRKHVKCTCDRFLQGCSPESCRAAIIVFLREWFFFSSGINFNFGSSTKRAKFNAKGGAQRLKL